MKNLRYFSILLLFFSISRFGVFAQPKSNLSLAQEAEIYKFAYEILDQQISVIPEAWRVVAERHGVDELKRRLQLELDAQKKNEPDPQEADVLEVKAVPFDELY